MPLTEDLRRYLRNRSDVRLAVLFGSSARGDSETGADVDIALEVSRCDASARLDLESSLGRALGRPVDIVYLDRAPPLLRFEIARTGVVLSERVPSAWADFRARAMIDWWDCAPTLRRLWAASRDRLRQKVASGQE